MVDLPMSNPSSKKRASYRVKVDEDYCKGCLLCVYACKNYGTKALVESERRTALGGGLPAQRGECSGCRFCERFCPDFSIAVEEEQTC